MAEPDTIAELENHRDVLVVRVPAGQLATFDAAMRFERELRRCAAERCELRWVIDFGRATLFLPLAVNALLAVQRSLRDRGGELLLTGLSADGEHVLRLMGLSRILVVAPDAATALAALRTVPRADGVAGIAEAG